MYLIYHPEGSEEPKRWVYDPKRLMSVERELLEKLTGRDFAEVTQLILKGNALCRRALLFIYLKRDHPPTRFADVDFAWDELTLEHTKGELQLIREQAAEHASVEQRDAILSGLDAEIAKMPDVPEEQGKAALPIVG